MYSRFRRRGLPVEFVEKRCCPNTFGKEGYNCMHFIKVKQGNLLEVTCDTELCPRLGKGYLKRKWHYEYAQHICYTGMYNIMYNISMPTLLPKHP